MGGRTGGLGTSLSPGGTPEPGSTFLRRLAQGFWARAKPVWRSWASLKPPNSVRWKASLCQVRSRSPSSDTSERHTEACREASRSAEDMKHCQALERDPYRGPGDGSSTLAPALAAAAPGRLPLLESTTGFHLALHWLSCWAYWPSSRARSWKQAATSLQARKAAAVRRTLLR